MANAYSQVVLVGNVVRDTELREAGNTVVTDNAIAITEKRGESESTTFVDITLWGGTAEHFQKYCPKGRTVLISGNLRQDKWQDKDGNNRSKLFVNVDRLVLLGSKVDKAAEPATVGAGAGSDDLPF